MGVLQTQEQDHKRAKAQTGEHAQLAVNCQNSLPVVRAVLYPGAMERSTYHF